MAKAYYINGCDINYLAKEAMVQIPNAKGEKIFVKKGDTQDIIDTILKEDKRAWKFTKEFAPFLKGETNYNTARNIWHFMKCNIKYKLDPFGEQYVKTPAQTWKDRFSDCKSYALFIASILKNLNIPYLYRFVGYGKNKNISHVYIVIPGDKKEIILDPVMSEFNVEKPYKIKKDYKMTKIYVIQGIGEPQRLRLNKPIQNISNLELDLLLIKQAIEIDKAIAENLNDNSKVDLYDQQLNAVNSMLSVMNEKGLSDYEKINRVQNLYNHSEINGCNNISGIFSRVEKVLKKPDAGKTALKNMNDAKKIAHTIENEIVSNAPYFLYLFINDQKIIKSLPPKARLKRKEAQDLAESIVMDTGLSRDQFMQLVRNGITKRFKRTPENVVAEYIRLGQSGEGIGALPAAIVAVTSTIKKVAPIVKKIGEGIKKLFGNKKNDDALSLKQWGKVLETLLMGATPRKAYEVFTDYSDLKYAKTRHNVWNSVFGHVGKDTWNWDRSITDSQREKMVNAALGEVNRFMQKTGQTISLSEEVGPDPSDFNPEITDPPKTSIIPQNQLANAVEESTPTQYQGSPAQDLNQTRQAAGFSANTLLILGAAGLGFWALESMGSKKRGRR